MKMHIWCVKCTYVHEVIHVVIIIAYFSLMVGFSAFSILM